MAHIIINPSLSAAIAYNLFLNPPKVAEVRAILEPANSTRTDYSKYCSHTTVKCSVKISSSPVSLLARHMPYQAYVIKNV